MIKLILYLNESAYKNKIISYKDKYNIENKLRRELDKDEFNRN